MSFTETLNQSPNQGNSMLVGFKNSYYVEQDRFGLR
jgi:hypothetical protein